MNLCEIIFFLNLLKAGVLAFSLILVVVLGYFYTGGFMEIFQIAEERGRIELLK